MSCSEGWVHRVKQKACSSKLPRPESLQEVYPGLNLGAAGSAGAGTNDAILNWPCTRDSDCNEKLNGFCLGVQTVPPSGPPFSSECKYGCVTDAGCGAGQICLCGDPVGECIPAGCIEDSSCLNGSACGSTFSDDGCGSSLPPFKCQTPVDECFGGGHCLVGGPTCLSAPSGNKCGQLRFSCGRPFVVAEAHRQGTLIFSGAWLEPMPAIGRDHSLSAGLRQKVSEHYARAALMEHASVAAFARFALHLLSMGAPAWLLDEAQQAMRDEIEHARICFTLASSFAEQPLGPSPLFLDGALNITNPRDIILTLVKEACIGETLAAIEASEASREATVPEIAKALAKISQDETRHAQLGWKSLVWALQAVDLRTRRELVKDLQELLKQALLISECIDVGEASVPEQGTLSAYGIPSDQTARSVRSAAMTQVVAPILRTLLSSAEPPALMIAMQPS